MAVRSFKQALTALSLTLLLLSTSAFAKSIVIEKGDGVSDDTDRIHAKIVEASTQNKGIVFDGTGTYRVRGLYLHPERMPRFIDGRGATIKMLSEQTVNGSTILLESPPAGFYMTNLIIDGNRTNSIVSPCSHVHAPASANYGLQLLGATGITLERLDIKNHNYSGLLLLGSQSQPIKENIFRSLYLRYNGEGLAAVSTDASHAIENNTFIDTNVSFSGTHGIRFVRAKKNTWLGGAIENSGAHGIKIYNSSQLQFHTYHENYGGWKRYTDTNGTSKWCERDRAHHALLADSSSSDIFFRGRIESEEHRSAGTLVNKAAHDVKCLEITSGGKRLESDECPFPEVDFQFASSRYQRTEAPDFIRVEDFPRLPGERDDTARITRATEEAVNERKGLVFSRRAYFTKSLYFGIWRDSTGVRRKNTVPKYIDGNGAYLFFIEKSGDAIRIENPHGNIYSANFSLKNFTILGNNRADAGVRVKGAQRTVLTNLRIYRAKQGLVLEGSAGHGIYYNRFENISIWGSRDTGLTLESKSPWDWKYVNGNTFVSTAIVYSKNLGIRADGAASNIFIPASPSRKNLILEFNDAISLTNTSDFEMMNTISYSFLSNAISIGSPFRGFYYSGIINAPNAIADKEKGCGYLIDGGSVQIYEYCG